MLIERYRNIPQKIQAVKLTAENLDEVAIWLGKHGTTKTENGIWVNNHDRTASTRVNFSCWMIVKFAEDNFWAYPEFEFIKRFQPDKIQVAKVKDKYVWSCPWCFMYQISKDFNWCMTKCLFCEGCIDLRMLENWQDLRKETENNL